MRNHGAFLLAIYCTGLGLPFLITGLAFGTVTSALTIVKRHYRVVMNLWRRNSGLDGHLDLHG